MKKKKDEYQPDDRIIKMIVRDYQQKQQKGKYAHR